MTPPTPAHTPTVWATEASLTRLAAGLTSIGLVWLAAWILLAPPEGVPGHWGAFALISSGLAVAAASGMLWPHLVLARWIPVTTATLALSLLVWINGQSGLAGWWLAIELAALLAIAATGSLPSWPAALAQLVILGLTGSVMVRAYDSESLTAGIPTMASVSARLLVTSGTVLIGSSLLRRASHGTDVLLERGRLARQELVANETRARTDRAARHFLHDSGMNSLEAVHRGVPAEVVPTLRTRAAADAARWLGAAPVPMSDIAVAFRPALQEAAVRGVAVRTNFAIAGTVPDSVAAALTDAAAEALRNSATHANVDAVDLDIVIAKGSATVSIRDAGVGFDPTAATARLGVSESIRRRLADAGGEADIVSAPGAGTVVTLRWPGEPDLRGASPGTASTVELNLPALAARLAWLPIGLVALGAIVLTRVNWWSVQSAWILGLAGLMLAGAAGWLVRRWQTARLDRFDVTLVISAVAVTTLAMPIADPFCSAASGQAMVPDGRLIVLGLLGALLASPRISALALGAALITLAISAAMWASLWPICADETIPTGVAMMLVTAAGLIFGQTMRAQQVAAQRAFAAAEATDLELARQTADALARAAWEVATVAQVRELLRTIADPTTDVTDPALRRVAGDAASRLRTTVQIAGLPAPLATALTSLVERGRVGGFGVYVDGDVAGAGDISSHDDPSPAELVRPVANALEAWLNLEHQGVTAARLTLSEFGGVSSLLVRLDSATPGTSDQPAPETLTSAITVDSWQDDAGCWWQAQWTPTAVRALGYDQAG